MRKRLRLQAKPDAGPPDGASEAVTPLARHRWWLAALVVGSLTVAGFGVLSPLWIKSPQQLAAEAGPPPASVLTAPVEERVVSQTVVLRGEITSQQVFEVTPASSGGTTPVVTDLRVGQGDEFDAGEVLVEVSGRPLVALPGDTPAYRDLRPGAEGEDIAQLQQALAELGHGVGEVDGYFGPATKRAVESYYEALGYPVPTTGEGDGQTLAAVQDEVTQLERQVDDARAALANADPAEQEQARKALDRAEEDLDRARERLGELQRRTGPMVPRAELVFLPDFPARVHVLAAQVGDPVEAPLIRLASGPLVVEAEVSTAQREVLAPDLPVEITPDRGEPVAGHVRSVDESPQEPGDPSALPRYTLLVEPEPLLDSELSGQGARLTVVVDSSGEEVLAVPVSALYADYAGTAYVLKQTEAGEQPVTVTLIANGDGYVAVAPVDGELRPGDQVVVGADSAPPPVDG